MLPYLKKGSNNFLIMRWENGRVHFTSSKFYKFRPKFLVETITWEKEELLNYFTAIEITQLKPD